MTENQTPDTVTQTSPPINETASPSSENIAKEIPQSKREDFSEGFLERVDGELGEIREYDSQIKTVSDLPKMKNFDSFRELVSKGLTYIEAYRLANYSEIVNGLKKRQTENSGIGRSHLTKSPVRGGGEYEVPQTVLEYYRAMNPGSTDSEIRRAWNKYKQTK